MLQAANLPICYRSCRPCSSSWKKTRCDHGQIYLAFVGLQGNGTCSACHLRPPSFKSRLGICALMAVLNSEYPSTLFESQEDMIRRVRERVVANLANPEVHCALVLCK